MKGFMWQVDLLWLLRSKSSLMQRVSLVTCRDDIGLVRNGLLFNAVDKHIFHLIS